MMTEKEAWIEIAKACESSDEKGQFTCMGHRGLWGLCSVIRQFYLSDKIACLMAINMNNKIRKHTKSSLDQYVWPLTKDGALARAAFCRKMASMED